MAKWIAKAIKHPGALHRALHVPAGQKITAKKMTKAEHSKSGKVRKEAALAHTLAKLRPHKGSGPGHSKMARRMGGRA